VATKDGELVHFLGAFDPVTDEYADVWALWRIDRDMLHLLESSRSDEYVRRRDAGESELEEHDLRLQSIDPGSWARHDEYHTRLAALGEPMYARGTWQRNARGEWSDVTWTAAEPWASLDMAIRMRPKPTWPPDGSRALEVLVGRDVPRVVEALVGAMCDPRATDRLQALAAEVLACWLRARAGIMRWGEQDRVREARAALHAISQELRAACVAAVHPGDLAALPPVLRDAKARIAALGPLIARTRFPYTRQLPDGTTLRCWQVKLVDSVPASFDAILREVAAAVGVSVDAKYPSGCSAHLEMSEVPDDVALRFFVELDRRMRIALLNNIPAADWEVLVSARG
jgi:hypothetical protein